MLRIFPSLFRDHRSYDLTTTKILCELLHHVARTRQLQGRPLPRHVSWLATEGGPLICRTRLGNLSSPSSTGWRRSSNRCPLQMSVPVLLVAYLFDQRRGEVASTHKISKFSQNIYIYTRSSCDPNFLLFMVPPVPRMAAGQSGKG